MSSLQLLPMRAARCGFLLWKVHGASFATVFVKATLQPDERGELILAHPGDPIAGRDEHWDGDARRSLREVSDRVPYLPRGEVLLTGHAHSTGGSRGVVRVTVARPGSPPVVDRRVVVRGDDAPRGRALVVPLTYENAFGGAGHVDNPVGRANPLLVDPLDPNVPASFGPRAASWPGRARLVSAAQRRALQGDPCQLDDVTPDYFHAAPPPQRAAGFFVGDEIVSVEGVTATGARIQWRLPGVRAVARVMSDGPAPTPLRLVADVLRVDTDKRCVSLVFRGYMPLTAGVTHSIAVSLSVPADEQNLDSTVGHSGVPSSRPSLPFRGGAAPSTPRPRTSCPVPGAPWTQGPVSVAPRATSHQPHTLALSAADFEPPPHAAQPLATPARVPAIAASEGALGAPPVTPPPIPLPPVEPRPSPPPASSASPASPNVAAAMPAATTASHLAVAPAPSVRPSPSLSDKLLAAGVGGGDIAALLTALNPPVQPTLPDDD